MLWPAPSPTPFPYTTLFRSHLHNVPLQIAAERGLPALIVWVGFVVVVARALFRMFRRPRCSVEPPGASAPASDRKSTRLNSSHLVISYAVFCLKKKKLQLFQ